MNYEYANTAAFSANAINDMTATMFMMYDSLNFSDDSRIAAIFHLISSAILNDVIKFINAIWNHWKPVKCLRM